MASNRRKKQKAKQRRHAPEQVANDSVETAGREDGRSEDSPKPAKSNPKTSTEGGSASKTKSEKTNVSTGAKKKRRSAQLTPVSANGTLDWNKVNLKLPPDKERKQLKAMTSGDLMNPGLGIFSVCMCLIGIVFTGRWSLLLLAVLAAVLMIDPRVRDRRQLLIKCVTGSALAIACLPLVSRLPDSLPSINESLLGSVVVIMFATSLWLIGGAARQASRLQDRPFPQVGLYSVGMACQVLCCIVLVLAAVLITLIVNQVV